VRDGGSPELSTVELLVTVSAYSPCPDDFRSEPSTIYDTRHRNAAGALEMMWSFASPDGRAIFELVTVEGNLRYRWRRLGEHGVFKRP
jgi:hypothetical protein